MSLTWLKLSRPHYHLALCQEVQDVAFDEVCWKAKPQRGGDGQGVIWGFVGGGLPGASLLVSQLFAPHPNTCL